MPRESKKKVKPSSSQTDYPDKIEILNKMLDLEKEKEATARLELEYSAKSSRDAAQLAKEELVFEDLKDERTFKFKSKLIYAVTIVFLVFIILIGILGYSNNSLVDKMLGYLKDIIKIAGGFAVGLFYQKSKK